MSKTDEILLSAWSSFFVAHGLSVRKIQSELDGKAPLSLDEYDILLVILRSKDSKIRLSSLADATVFTRSGITRVAKRLEERKFITKQGCPKDKRGSYAVITAEGKKALKDSWKLYSKAILNLFQPCFSESEANKLTLLLERLIDQLKAEPLVQIGKVIH